MLPIVGQVRNKIKVKSHGGRYLRRKNGAECFNLRRLGRYSRATGVQSTAFRRVLAIAQRPTEVGTLNAYC